MSRTRATRSPNAFALPLRSKRHPLTRLPGRFRRSAPTRPPPELEVSVGAGVSGLVDGACWKLGSAGFVGREGEAGDGEIYLTRENRPVAVFSIDDPLRTDAADTVSRLKDAGYSISLLSGDAAGPVARIASAVGIDDARPNSAPDDKVDRIRSLQSGSDVVLMVGDGVNDAPVLAGADVSIAPSKAASLAQSTADVLLLGNRLGPIGTLLDAARRTMRIVRQNLTWAILYNVSAIPLAAAGLVPPWLAAIGMSASSLIVVLNAMRLGRIR